MLLRALRRLGTLYRRHPVAANVITYGTLYGAGDVSQQTITRRREYDWANTSRVVTVGAAFFGPFYTYWYRFLDKFIVGRGWQAVVKKVAFDQVFAGAVCVGGFFAGLGILEGRENPFEEVIEKGPKTYALGCLFWPAAQAVNFLFLPTHLRPVYVSVVAFCWLNVVCYIKMQV